MITEEWEQSISFAIVFTQSKHSVATPHTDCSHTDCSHSPSPAPARTGKSLEIEKFLRQVAFENGIKINFDKCPGGVCKPAPKKQPAKKKPDDDLYSDDSDLESCDDEE